ncbi:MAG: thioredoxin [Acidimicrobiales bacterium]
MTAGRNDGWPGIVPQDRSPGDSRRRLTEEGEDVALQELTLTDQTFDEEIKAAGQPVLVDFWAEWCGPCKMVAPILDEIAREQAGTLRIGKINIDDNMDLARRFDVMSIPTLILFKDGEPQLRIVGARGKGQLLEELRPYL